jgi:uncharacterized repeat protein (TIGR03806 family)
MLNRVKLTFGVIAAMALSACSNPQSGPQYHASGNPVLLSDWGQFEIENGQLSLSPGVVPYDLNTPLFTDYAHKLRTIWIPEGSAIYREQDPLDFPVGTVITKTFYYPQAPETDLSIVMRTSADEHNFQTGTLDLTQVKLIETRILVHRPQGWDAIVYIWPDTDTQMDAPLHRIGAIIPMTLLDESGSLEAFNYIVPNINQCSGCHATNATTRDIQLIGLKARHINRSFPYPNGEQNQLEYLTEIGYLTQAPSQETTPRNADWSNFEANLNDRARAYLDINCSHCHNTNGPADTSGLFFESWTQEDVRLGICKLPIAAGSGTGNRIMDIIPGNPEDSILTYRMATTKPDEMMPELGRSTRHTQGLALITEWIETMHGSCD